MEEQKQPREIQIEGEQKGGDLSYRWILKNQDVKLIEQSIPIINFQEHYLKRNIDLEYQLLKKITESQGHADIKVSDIKLNKLNRYDAVTPYKHNIVHIYRENESQDPSTLTYDNYLNASWVDCCNGQEKVFIATQGPKKNTFVNFWKMVWAQNVRTILMLCDFKENDKNQCDQYFPASAGEPEQHGPYLVTLVSADFLKNTSIIERKFTIQLLPDFAPKKKAPLESDASREKQGGEDERGAEQEEGDTLPTVKQVTQLQWAEWPDHGQPAEKDYTVIQLLVDSVIQNIQHNEKTLVHCSAGVGRTGTIIALVNLTITINSFAHLLQ